MKIRALKDKVLVNFIERGERVLGSGVVLLDDDGTEGGIRERWAQVYSVGENVNDLREGQWVYIKHGRWSREVRITRDGEELKIHSIDWPDGCLLVSDERPY